MPENHLKEVLSAAGENRQTPLRSNPAAGFVRFTGMGAFCVAVIGKLRTAFMKDSAPVQERCTVCLQRLPCSPLCNACEGKTSMV